MNKQGKINNWDQRLIRGLTGIGVAGETADALVAALGALGCEAEFALNLLYAASVVPHPTHAQGELWLQQCYRLAQRLVRTAADLEIAIQSYLSALLALDSTLARLTEPASATHVAKGQDMWGARFDATPDVWWPEHGEIAVSSESLELWLRRAGFAYRYTISVGLPEHCEALAGAMELVLHALRTIPPGGVLTRASLYLSLVRLASEIEGDLIPHHIHDIDTRHIGLLTGIATILRLAKTENDSLASDIHWAQGELERARIAIGDQPTNGRVTRPLVLPTGSLWARQIVREWEQTVAQLTALQTYDNTVSSPR